MYTLYVIILCNFVFAQTRFVPVNPDSSQRENIEYELLNTVQEIQHATCNISSADLKATANATVTRQLKGVCTTVHLDSRMDVLEKTLLLEINNIKNLLEDFQGISIRRLEESKRRQDNNIYTRKLNSNTSDQNLKKTVHVNKKPSEQALQIKTFTQSNSNSLDRESEILKNNMTLQKDESGITFLYYWKIENISKLLTSSEAIESGDFHFSGNHLYIKVFPNYIQTNYMIIQIIGLEEFKLAHKFAILNQINPELDLTSPLLICDKVKKMLVECTGFQIPHDSILSRNLIMNNTLIVKLLIYLEY